MILRNRTRRTILTKELLQATDLKKIIGLMGAKTPQALLLKTHFGIHTLFLKFPIDILIVDNENHIVQLKENLMPWHVYTWNPTYGIVIELPSRTISKSKTLLGDTIQIS